MTPQTIPVDEIVPSALNPPGRLNPNDPELLTLVESVRAYGVREPPTVYRDPKAGRYVLLSGHRRWYAAQASGHKELLCLLAEPPAGPGEELLRQAIVNIQRRGYTPLEFARLAQGLMTEFGLSGKEAAAKLHVSPALVSTHLSLLRLGAAHQRLIDEGKVSLSVGTLMSQTDDPALRDRLAEMACRGASRKEVAAALGGQKAAGRGKRIALRSGAVSVSADTRTPLAALIRDLSGLLRQARRAAADGKGLEELSTNPTDTPRETEP
jgi:ParB family chromosome partitioning protein